MTTMKTSDRRSPTDARADAYSLDESIAYLMNRVVGHLNRALESDLRKMRLSFQHWRVLAVLAMRDGRTIAELAEYAVLPHSTLSRLLTRMEHAGLLSRQPSGEDMRVAEIHLSARGRRSYERILPFAIARRDDALTGFSASEQAQCGVLLKRMLANLESRKAGPSSARG